MNNPTDDELAALGLPSGKEIRAIFQRAHRVNTIIRAAGWDPSNPNTPFYVLKELAEQILDAAPGTLEGYPSPWVGEITPYLTAGDDVAWAGKRSSNYWDGHPGNFAYGPVRGEPDPTGDTDHG
jgi:hypothetical protein